MPKPYKARIEDLLVSVADPKNFSAVKKIITEASEKYVSPLDAVAYAQENCKNKALEVTIERLGTTE